MKRSWLLALLLLAGCGDPAIIPLLGHWTGSFLPDKGQPEFRGFLHLYQTRSSFKLELKNKVQTFRLDGTWQVKGRQIQLSVDKFACDQPPEEEAVPGMPRLLPADQVQAALGKTILLNLSENKKSLVGLPSRFGSQNGALVFEHIASSSYPTN